MWGNNAICKGERLAIPVRQWILLVIGAILVFALPAHASPNDDIVISKYVNGATAYVKGSTNYGGAVTSFNYRSFEYVDTFDKGREIQSAVSFEGYWECWAPTQAGNRVGDASSLQAYSSNNGVLSTQTDMKYWQPASDPSRTGIDCVTHQSDPLPYGSDDSGVILEKSVTFDTSTAAENVLNFNAKYTLPAARSSGRFEVNDAYLNSNLSHFYRYYPESSSISPLSLTSCGTNCTLTGGINGPILVTTANGQQAVGVYQTAPVSEDATNVGYVIGGSHPTTLVACVRDDYVSATISTAAKEFDCKLVFGTVEEVAYALRELSVQESIKIWPVFRFFYSPSGDHFATQSYSEGASAGYAFEATAFRVFGELPEADSMVPLYRCSTGYGAYHFVSNYSNCEGQTYEGAYGWISSCERSGYEPLYRFYKSSNTDHLVTTNAAEGYGAGYTLDGVLGYAPTSNGSIPSCS